ncbi:AAA family ATPase [Streptococcus pluranimalium]|uniref:AAA family ATPase n=1 Tax=Streptococcus pluranimalium TaxID=82348 RepID=UPI00346606EF
MINIYYGSNKYFNREIEELIKGCPVNTLSNLLDEMAVQVHRVEGIEKEGATIRTINHLVIGSDEYSRLSDSGFNSFRTVLLRYKIKNLYVQNPPQKIQSILKERKEHEVNFFNQKYNKFNLANLDEFRTTFDDYILGQSQVQKELTRGLYRVAKGYNKDKPLVILFYGPTGVGKTETANFLSKISGEKLFRKQFSMYQTAAFSDFLFGSSHASGSFAQELLERESNIILLDEFDKGNSMFYSAFYQIFDEGIFTDKNYSVHLENSIIICTSNFLDENHIRDVLGDPIYNRFDMTLKFSELSEESTKQIIEQIYNKLISDLDDDDKEILTINNCLGKLLSISSMLKNVRAIKRVVNDAVIEMILQKKKLN